MAVHTDSSSMDCIRRLEVIISIANRRHNAHDEEKEIQEVEVREAGSGKGFNKKGSHLEAKALGVKTDASICGGSGNYFDCNICLNLARDPVLTCCGHLFCWSCLHQLAYVYENVRECPVCDGEVIETETIPIYGTAGAIGNCEPRLRRSGLRIPPRPVAPGADTFSTPAVLTAVSRLVRNQTVFVGMVAARVQSENLNSATDRNNGLVAQSLLDTTYDISMFLEPGAASISSPGSPSRMDVDSSEIQTTDTNLQTDTSPSSSTSHRGC